MGKALAIGANLNLAGLRTFFNLALVGDQLAFFGERFNLGNLSTGRLLRQPDLHVGGKRIERDLFLDLGNGAIRGEQDIPRVSLTMVSAS